MDQAQRARDDPPAMPAGRSPQAMPRLRSFDDISHYVVEIHRLENDGDRVVARGHGVAVRDAGSTRWSSSAGRTSSSVSRTRSTRPSTSPTSLESIVIKNCVSAAWTRHHPRHRRRHRAGVRLHQRLPRHRERDRDVDLDAGDVAALAVALAAILNFVGAFISLEVAATVANGIVDADDVTTDDRLRRAHRRDRLEPRTWYFGPAVELVARAHRRRGGRGVRRRGRGRGERRRPASRRSSSRRSSRPLLAFVAAGIAILIAYRIVGRLRPGPGQPRLPARAARVGLACSRWRTARTTRRRRWASSRSR